MKERMPISRAGKARQGRSGSWLVGLVAATCAGYAATPMYTSAVHTFSEASSAVFGEHHTAEVPGVRDPIPWDITAEPEQQKISTAIGGELKSAVCSTVRGPLYARQLFPNAAGAVACQSTNLGLEVHDPGRTPRAAADISLTTMTVDNFRLEDFNPGTNCNFRTMTCTRITEEGLVTAESFYDGRVAAVAYEGQSKPDTHIVHTLAILAANLAKLPGSQV